MAKRRKGTQVSFETYQAIAMAIVNNPNKPLKSFCGEFDVSYNVVWRALKEFVNVKKTLSLRYPNGKASLLEAQGEAQNLSATTPPAE